MSGRFDAYVPIVDWGVRAKPYRGPFRIDLEFRSLDRDAALAAVRSGPAAQRNLRLLEDELRESVEAGFRRAAFSVLAGGLLGGFLAGAVIVACGRRQRGSALARAPARWPRSRSWWSPGWPRLGGLARPAASDLLRPRGRSCPSCSPSPIRS